MKRVLYILIVAIVLSTVPVTLAMLPGCETGQRLQKAIETYRLNSPEAGPAIPIDDTGDGVIDAFAEDENDDGIADRDDDGNIVEVEGTREPLNTAAQIDTDIAEILGLITAIVGVPGIGLVGAWWGRRRPVQRFSTVVRSFEKAKQDGAPEGYITLSKDVLKSIQAEMPELRTLIDKIRNSG